MTKHFVDLPAPILAHLETVDRDQSLISKIPDLVAAISTGNYEHALFSDEQLATLILLAYKQQLITETQMTSAILVWEAKTDFPTMQNFTVFDLKTSAGKQALMPYLDIYGGSCERTVDDMAFLYEEDYPESEQYFVRFDVPLSCLPIIYTSLINKIEFKFFMPIITDEWAKFIVPSFTILQKALDSVEGHRLRLLPRFGEDNYAVLNELHNQGLHPLGLSFPLPGFERLEADQNACLRLGFSLHDLYHIILLKFNPVFPQIRLMTQCINALAETKPDMKQIYNHVVDGEMNNYRALAPNASRGSGFEVYLFLIIQSSFLLNAQISENLEAKSESALQEEPLNPLRLKDCWIEILTAALELPEIQAMMSATELSCLLYGENGLGTSINQSDFSLTDISLMMNYIHIQSILIAFTILEEVLFERPTTNPYLLGIRNTIRVDKLTGKPLDDHPMTADQKISRTIREGSLQEIGEIKSESMKEFLRARENQSLIFNRLLQLLPEIDDQADLIRLIEKLAALGLDLNTKHQFIVQQDLFNAKIYLKSLWQICRGFSYPVFRVDLNFFFFRKVLHTLNLSSADKCRWIELGADPNQADMAGKIELIEAILAQDTEYDEFLRAHGARDTIRDKDNQTARMLLEDGIGNKQDVSACVFS